MVNSVAIRMFKSQPKVWKIHTVNTPAVRELQGGVNIYTYSNLPKCQVLASSYIQGLLYWLNDR